MNFLSDQSPWMRKVQNGTVIDLSIQPGAKRTEIVGVHSNRLKVRVAAPPVEGAANEALTKWLAKTMGLRKSEVEIVKGQTNRLKSCLLLGLTVSDVRELLLPLIARGH
jgi:hypothetical protein